MKHQMDAFDKALIQLRTVGGGVLTLPCGFGKTVIGLKLAATLAQKTLVVVNKEFLMDQWIERIEQFMPKAKIGIIQQDKVGIADNDIIIAMIHSLSRKDYPIGTFDEIGFVIFDECHHLAAEMFSKALPKVASQYNLGLSATPNRKDGLSYVFYHYLGPQFHQEKRTGANIVSVKQIRITSTTAHYENKYNNIRGKQMKNTKGMIGELCLFKERNELAIKTIEVLIRQERTILVLSERREHLENFIEMMNKASFRTPQNRFVTYGLYYGKSPGINKKAHKKMLEETAKCDVVFGTTAIASEALDIPNLNTLLMLSPMTDVEQASGRILRKFHDKINPMIIDIIDKCGNFPKHAKMREDYFRIENYIIESYGIVLYEIKPNKWDGLISYLNHKNGMTSAISIKKDKNKAMITHNDQSLDMMEQLVKLVSKGGPPFPTKKALSESKIDIELKTAGCLLDIEKNNIKNISVDHSADSIHTEQTQQHIPTNISDINKTIKKRYILTPKKKLNSTLE